MSSSVFPLEVMAAITLRNQVQSPLLRLPGEICNRIYAYIYPTDGTLIPLYSSVPWSAQKRCIYISYDISASPTCQPLFALLQSQSVCRQYYAETKLLVSQNDKLIVRLDHLPGLVMDMPKDVRNAISTVHVYEQPDRKYVASFSSVSAFENLRRLNYHAPRDWPAALRRVWLHLITQQVNLHTERNLEIAVGDKHMLWSYEY